MPDVSKKMKNSGSFVKSVVSVVIASITAAAQQLTTLGSYRCPCVSVANLPNCTSAALGSSACSRQLNFAYGISFMLAPAMVLFLFGVAANPHMWKTMTGLFWKTAKQRREKTEVCVSVMRVFATASIAPITWVTVALLDGRFYACATTSLPYDVHRQGAVYKDCDAVGLFFC